MKDKLTIFKELMPKALLRATNPETEEAASTAVTYDHCIVITSFPFKVGRESRVVTIKGRLERIERAKQGNSEPNNDLYMVDRGHRMNISREHFQIEKRENRYVLVDRGSACGTRVGKRSIDGDDVGGTLEIKDGDFIGVGAQATPYVFEFITFDDCLPVTE